MSHACRQTARARRLLRRPASRGITLVEAVTTSAVLAIVLGLLLPAVQRAREASRQATCRSRMHQLGVAMANYELVHRVLPPGQIPAGGPDNGTGVGWTVQLLPTLGEDGVFSDLDFTADMTFTGPGQVNFTTASRPLPYFVCPSDGRSQVAGRGSLNYAGNRGAEHSPDADDGVLFDHSRVSFAAVRDGLARTILLVEIIPGEPNQPARTPTTWCGWKMAHIAPAGPINDNDSESGPERIRSYHPDGAHALFCDGSVRLLSEEIDAQFNDGRTGGVLGALLTRAGREPLDDRDF